jgi:ferredoxin--NADP+ reductase
MASLNRIVEKKEISDGVWKMVVEAPEIAGKRKAGQFVVLMTHEKGERIPLTMVDSDPAKGTVTIVFQVVGKTTAFLAAMKEGESLFGVLGPLGHATEIENFGTALCVGGGVGIGVVYPISRALKEKGNRVVSIIGARTKNLLILEEEMKAASDVLHVATDDGSYGIPGFVTSVLKNVLDSGEKIDRIFAIGPVPMMRAVCNVTRPYGVKTIVSLNPIMVDATGMCGACRVNVGGKTKLGCVDGPEFDGHKVDFDLLMKRLRMYCDEEEKAMEHYRCGCRDGR